MPVKSGEIEGLDELIDDFLTFGKTAMPYLQSASNFAARVVWETARYRAPKDDTWSFEKDGTLKHKPGTLRNEIIIKPARISKSNKHLVTTSVELDKKSEYGMFVELGHNIKNKQGDWLGYANPRPFMRPAADENKEYVMKILVNGMNRAIRELGDK